MKIAIVVQNLSFITGGPRLLLGLAKELMQMGDTVVVYTEDKVGDFFGELARGIVAKVVELPAPAGPRSGGFFGWISGKAREEFGDILWAKKVAAAMDSDFDVVNVHDFAYRVGYFYKKRNLKTKVVWQENQPLLFYVKRGKVLYDLIGPLYWWVKKFTDKKYFDAMDGISVLDELTKTQREARGFSNVRIIRAGVDFQKFYAPVKNFSPKAARKEAQLFALGALNFVRRFDNVVEAVRYLREWGYSVTATIVAKNIWHEDQCKEDLIAFVKKCDLEQYVKLNFDGLSEADLIKTFHASDVFVQAAYAPPPSHQGWGLVNFEALAAGLALVVVRSSGATEVLEDGKTALFFDPLQPEQIARKVKFLIDRPQEYDRIAKTGQSYVRENQSWKRYAAEMREFFLGK